MYFVVGLFWVKRQNDADSGRKDIYFNRNFFIFSNIFLCVCFSTLFIFLLVQLLFNLIRFEFSAH